MQRLRESLGLAMRDVQHLSRQIAKSLENPDYIVSISRLCDIGRKGQTPNIHRLHALSLVYDCRVEKLLAMYDID